MNTYTEQLEFPVSLILAISFLLITIVVFCLQSKSRAIRSISSTKTARILLAAGAVMLAVEGTFSIPIHESVPFVLYALMLLMSLALTILNGIRRKAKVGFLLNHVGIFLIIGAALFGAPDVSRSKMMVVKGDKVNFSYDSEWKTNPLPFSVSLEDFCIDYYPDSINPRQYTSKLLIDGDRHDVAVNEPLSYHGYTIYQEGFGEKEDIYTMLQVVRDPWMPVVYLGMTLLAVGSIMLLFGRWKYKYVVPVTLLLTAGFTALTVAKINFGTLMPALRSWWFVPHLFIYMVAYSLMALAVIGSFLKRFRHTTIPEQLVRSSSALLIIGMLTGSVWARQAWGDYWAWDPKENWAAVTWFVSLIFLHLMNKKGMKAATILILAFLALQITWYGVNYLPSAMSSIHTYNQ